MKERIISFETAKLAKEKGFKIPCYRHYNKEGKLIEHSLENGSSTDVEFEVELEDLNENFNYYPERFNAPTQSLLQKWLREEHDVYLNITPMAFRGVITHYKAEVAVPSMVWDEAIKVPDGNYEEVLEVGLREALGLI